MIMKVTVSRDDGTVVDEVMFNPASGNFSKSYITPELNGIIDGDMALVSYLVSASVFPVSIFEKSQAAESVPNDSPH